MRTLGRAVLVTGGLLLAGTWAASWPETPAAASTPLWLAPATEPSAPTRVAVALRQLGEGKAEAALPALRAAAAGSQVGPWVRVHQGRAELALGQIDAAEASGQAAWNAATTPYLREQALWLVADAAEAAEDWPAASNALDALVNLPSTRPAQAWFRLGKVSKQLGRTERAVDAFARVYFDYPLTSEATEAAGELAALEAAVVQVTAERAPRELRRAEALFGAGRVADARKAFTAVRSAVSGIDRHTVTLRLAQLDIRQRRWVPARTAIDALLARTDVPEGLRDEVGLARLTLLRESGRHTEYERAVQPFVDHASSAAIAESALNDLGTHLIVTDRDREAAEVFTQQYDRFPSGPYGGRAAWKAGWWAFSSGDFAETVRQFESAAVVHPRADYRSGWVYWAARAHERLGHREQAIAGYDRTIADYGNSYYGREAARAREALLAATRPAGAGPVAAVRRDAPPVFEPGDPPTTAPLIQQLLAAQMWDDAIGEIQSAKRVEGVTPVLEATLAYAYNRKGELRLAISAMKRAYPRYLADGSETLPREILTVLFPLDHWDLLQRYARAHALDPFLLAALVAQESTFDAGIRSAANAWGLMQIVPATGSRYARTLGIRGFRTASLTRPETNVRIGTKYLADLIKRYNGAVAPALAAYNAGEHRADRWLKERPGLDRDEFIDGIPFPETQGYVKKILGTAEDYRVLYRRTDTR